MNMIGNAIELSKHLRITLSVGLEHIQFKSLEHIEYTVKLKLPPPYLPYRDGLV